MFADSVFADTEEHLQVVGPADKPERAVLVAVIQTEARSEAVGPAIAVSFLHRTTN